MPPTCLKTSTFLIAEYYGNIQFLSVRPVIWQVLKATNDTRDRLIYLGHNFNKDMLHVTSYGHRWYADILINYFQEVAATLVTKMLALAAISGSDTDLVSSLREQTYEAERAGWSDSTWTGSGLAPHPPPISPPAPASAPPSPPPVPPAHTATCLIRGRLGTDYPVFCSPSGLKPPLFLDNEVEPGGVCAIGGDFEHTVNKPHDGWEWVDEGKNGQHKWGYVSELPGSKLTMNINITGHVVSHKLGKEETGGGSGGQRTRSRKIMAWLIYLHSWQNLGIAELSCSDGCSCPTTFINGLNKDTTIKGTVPALHRFDLEKQDPDQSPDCIIKITVMKETDSESNKFKVIGITTSTYPMDKLFSTISDTIKNPSERDAATDVQPLG
eukprot:gene30737-35773_t